MGVCHLRRCAVLVCAGAAVALLAPAADAAAPVGSITSQTGWRLVARLGRNLTVSHKTITVAGYRGTRTLTKITWLLGSPRVSLTAAAVAPRGYDGSENSFAEGRISGLARHSRTLVAGINGDTFCPGCARNGGDLLHGLLIHSRRLLTDGSGPAVGYLAGGRMLMGNLHAAPVRIALPNGKATVGVWNALAIPGRSMLGDQLAVFTKPGLSVAIPSTSTAVVVTGAVSVDGLPSTAGAQFGNMLRWTVPYENSSDRVVGPAGGLEWVDAYRIVQGGGTPETATMPVSAGTVSGADVTVPADGVVLVAPTTSTAGQGLIAAAQAGLIDVPLDDNGWGAATNVMDGKFQMVANGVAQTRYPGWSDSWPWYCQGTGWGCVRAAIGTKGAHGWLVVVKGKYGTGLTMPDFARVLVQLGVSNAMGFDSNTHADFWRRGGKPITADGWEPGAPAATLLHFK
jgi:hypothetical protein